MAIFTRTMVRCLGLTSISGQSAPRDGTHPLGLALYHSFVRPLLVRLPSMARPGGTPADLTSRNGVFALSIRLDSWQNAPPGLRRDLRGRLAEKDPGTL